MNRKAKPIPEPIVQLQRQLDQYRSTQSRRAKLPESLWQSATELARQYGVHSVAHPLRLDYMRLKRRLNDVAGPQRQSTKMAFVELVSPPPDTTAVFVTLSGAFVATLTVRVSAG